KSARFSPAEAPSLPSPLSVEPDPVSAAAGARRGCFIVAAIVALLGAIALTTVYFVRYRDRPLIFVEKPADASRP
ncbi:MAG TPA: hypothetical protein VEA63_05405, partial [Opitutus sp.]|nr:hypothetical protein [Opitutus sp.]